MGIYQYTAASMNAVGAICTRKDKQSVDKTGNPAEGIFYPLSVWVTGLLLLCTPVYHLVHTVHEVAHDNSQGHKPTFFLPRFWLYIGDR